MACLSMSSTCTHLGVKMCLIPSLQTRLQSHRMNMAPLVSFGYFSWNSLFVWTFHKYSVSLAAQQLTTAARWALRPSLTAPPQLIITTDTWVCTNMDTNCFWPTTVTLQYVHRAWLAIWLLCRQLTGFLCLCVSGQETFKRWPILSHLHHIGDMLLAFGWISSKIYT